MREKEFLDLWHVNDSISKVGIWWKKWVRFENPRNKKLSGIFRKQKHSCPICNKLFRPYDIIELHHVLDNEGNRTKGLQFLHGHCHDQHHSSLYFDLDQNYFE